MADAWNSTEQGQVAHEQDLPASGPVAPQNGDYSAPEAGMGTQQWDGSAPVYQWNDDYGDVGPRVAELEADLFGDPAQRHERAGLDFGVIDSIEVQQEGPVQITPIKTFAQAGLHPAMIENVALSGYVSPTPIQRYTLPAMLQGRDVIGIAQTGSGKTAAYLVPILSRLMGKAKRLAAPRPNPVTFDRGDEVIAEPLVLIVVPTRELAVQIFNEARKLCYRTMLRPCVVYGGLPVREQIYLLNKGCDILVGTPGRLIDFIGRPQNLTMRRLKYVVLDEADEMLDSSWDDDLQRILTGGEQDEGNIQYALFSATFTKPARDLAREHLAAAHVRFRVGRAGSTTANIQQTIVETERHEKRDVLLGLLGEQTEVRTIVFVNSRAEVDNLDDFLFNLGLPVTSIHGERTQSEREAAMRTFRSGAAPILIATGVTARGIDVRNVMHVINYDLPSMDHGGIEEYTHRIGRTGRIGNTGMATSFYTERDEPIASVLTRTLLETNQEIPEFLQLYVPADQEHIQFETESDFDPNDVAGAGEGSGDGEEGGAWGSDGAAGGNAWGTGAADTGNLTAPATSEAWTAPAVTPVAAQPGW